MGVLHVGRMRTLTYGYTRADARVVSKLGLVGQQAC